MNKHGKLEMRVTTLEALHHGAGSSGNTALLRTEDVILDDGRRAKVPFVSGNTVKHMIREAGVRHALSVLGLDRLSVPVVHLLFSGGHLSKTGGAGVDMRRARRLSEVFPILGLCGFSAGNVMTDSKVRCSKLHLVCEENRWRLPADCLEMPHAAQRSGAYRGEEMGTRREPTHSAHVRALLSDADRKLLDDGATEKLEASRAGEASERGASAQMIFEHEVLLPGARLFGTIGYHGLGDMELAALVAALSYACDGAHPGGGLLYRFGARSSVGMGLCSVQFEGAAKRLIGVPEFEPSDEVLPAVGNAGDAAMVAYVEHLRKYRDEIVTTLEQSA